MIQVKSISESYRARMGKPFPTMTLVEAKCPLGEGAMVEIQEIAVL